MKTRMLGYLLAGLIACTWTVQTIADDLAKASQNPVGDIISLPIELWHYGDMPGDSDATLLIAKPVYPVNIGKEQSKGQPRVLSPAGSIPMTRVPRRVWLKVRRSVPPQEWIQAKRQPWALPPAR